MAKDSLTNFANTLYSEAAKQKQAEAEKLEKEKAHTLAEADAAAERRFEKEIKAYETGLEYEVKIDISRREAELSKMLRNNRAAAAEEVFAAAEDSLAEFVETDKYEAYLKRRFAEVAPAFSEGETVCTARECDAGLIERVCPIDSIKFESAPDNIIGGFTLKNDTLKIMADCTLKSELDKQKNSFYKLSGLVID
ncbi:MAG: V-type ATP synthase subunit E family protein [Monoglobaceae bacterium]